jgi:histidine ammonia-lyase
MPRPRKPRKDELKAAIAKAAEAAARQELMDKASLAALPVFLAPIVTVASADLVEEIRAACLKARHAGYLFVEETYGTRDPVDPEP